MGSVQESDFFVWNVQIRGPLGTPYEGSNLECQVAFPFDYPETAPDVIFKTPVYHCNVSEKGLVCIDVLHDKWSPALSGETVLLSVVSLLTDPNPHDAINEEAAALYLSDKRQYDARARACVL